MYIEFGLGELSHARGIGYLETDAYYVLCGSISMMGIIGETSLRGVDEDVLGLPERANHDDLPVRRVDRCHRPHSDRPW